MDWLWQILVDSYYGYANYLWYILSNPFAPDNYFTLLIGISLGVWILELLFPWRKEQKPIRKQFWQDAFYMFFNFFLFNLFIFIALSNTTADLFGKIITAAGLPADHLLDMTFLPVWAQLLFFFVVADLVQWLVHNALHRIPWMWRFHRLHHSVTEMGFAAHLRYHFMESVFYKTVLYLTIAYVLNLENIENAFIVHSITILIGHLNHANLGWDYGIFKYLLNNPKMHIWHHAKELPDAYSKGANFAISLSVWDYLFNTNYIPASGRDIALGFEDIESYPEGFIDQQLEAFKRKK